jgi:hypothetical protein
MITIRAGRELLIHSRWTTSVQASGGRADFPQVHPQPCPPAGSAHPQRHPTTSPSGPHRRPQPEQGLFNQLVATR